MIRIGLTGGIGSGKSTVARLFAELGAECYDSDSRAKALMQKDPALREEIVRLFGSGAYSPEGRLDRTAVASAVFGSPERLAQLNGAVHPAVARDWERWCAERSGRDAVILESAILFESGFDAKVDISVTVSVPEQLRIERCMARDGVPAEAVRRRIAAQWSDGERERRADHIISNIDAATLREQVVRLYRTILQCDSTAER